MWWDLWLLTLFQIYCWLCSERVLKIISLAKFFLGEGGIWSPQAICVLCTLQLKMKILSTILNMAGKNCCIMCMVFPCFGLGFSSTCCCCCLCCTNSMACNLIYTCSCWLHSKLLHSCIVPFPIISLSLPHFSSCSFPLLLTCLTHSSSPEFASCNELLNACIIHILVEFLVNVNCYACVDSHISLPF